mmetsp:Transcript_24385/g.66534  ORF Transcript_24385/g.66534 Transcript_24385/m.66534 type:complete len:340 (-) Transcript_24385:74-1093(-)
MPLLAFIADVSSPNGKSMLDLLGELDGRASYIVGNDLASLESSGRLGEVEVLVVVVFAGGSPAVMAELWPHCPKLKWVHSMAAGVDTVVPVMNGLPRGPETPLTNAKGAFSRSLAEYALGAMLHFNKQVPRLQQSRRDRRWEKFIMAELHGKTAGFVGFGDIAQATARLCKAFGMRVMALRNARGPSGDELADAVRYASDADGAAGKLEVFQQSDFVVCTLPGGPDTKNACGSAEFAAMKPGGVFISMGRGTCVDEPALAEALQAGRIAGAALDVFAVEPLPQDSPLWGCESLLLSPHNADLTADYMRLTWDVFLGRLSEFSDPGFGGFASTVDKTKGY